MQKRIPYSKKRVKKLAIERRQKVPDKPGISHKQFQDSLGELKGAGHLTIIGLRDLSVEHIQPIQSPAGKIDITNYKLSFDSSSEYGERPHFRGYLQSKAKNDVKYKVKGWLNQDGTIRLEIVQ